MPRMRHTNTRLAIAVLMIAGCVRVARPGVPSPAPENAVVAAVYQALITHLEVDRRTIYVEGTSESYRVSQRPDNWERVGADTFPKELARRLEELSGFFRASKTLSLPAGVRIVTSEESAQLQQRSLAGGAILALSPVSLSGDSTDAVVYYETHCGGLCGRGALARFRRGPDGVWRFQTSYQFWVSEWPSASTSAPAG